MLLATLADQTASVFSTLKDEWKVPEPPTIWKDRLLALEEANLVAQRAACIFDMRKWQAAEMGFKEVSVPELVELLMKEPSTISAEGPQRQVHEWVYDHHTNEQFSKDIGWGSKPTHYKRIVRSGPWHLPPFSKITKWECIFGKLDSLKRAIPYGVVLRINEIKKLNLFNAFEVVAPKEAWERETDLDPIVMATIWELPPGEKRTSGQMAHYFLAQW